MTVTINGTTGVTAPEVTLDNSSADGGQVVLKSSGYSNWNIDNYNGSLRSYYGSTVATTIDSSGNVGIGTSGSIGGGTGERLAVTGALYSSTYPFTATFGDTATYNAGSNGGGIGFAAKYNSAGSYTSVSAIQGVKENTTDGNYAGALRFLTRSNGSDPAERMRIDSNGGLLVGTSTAYGGAIAGGIQTKTSGPGEQNWTCWNAATSGTRYYAYFGTGSSFTATGSITTNGTSTTYGTSSDYRLKENIQPMQNALDVVQQLNPVTYTWKEDGSDGQGFIAHELQAVVPDCVTGEKDAVDAEGKPVYQGIDTSFLVATLTKAIQELKAEVDALKGAK